MHICFPCYQKKTSARFLSFLFCCSAFLASNSLHIIQLIPCKSLWDLTSLVSWGDKCFLCDELGFTDLLFLVQPKQLTRCHRFHNRKNSLPHNFVFLLIQLHSMNLVLYKHHNFIQCFVLWLQDQTHSQQIPENPSWKFMSKGERENIKAYHLKRVYHLLKPSKGGERPSRGRDPQREERDLQGERILK